MPKDGKTIEREGLDLSSFMIKLALGKSNLCQAGCSSSSFMAVARHMVWHFLASGRSDECQVMFNIGAYVDSGPIALTRGNWSDHVRRSEKNVH